MSELNDRERELVALGAAIASNCIPCVEHLVPLARRVGLDEGQVEQAFRTADKVRRTPARNVMRRALEVLRHESEPAATAGSRCGCPGSATG